MTLSSFIKLMKCYIISILLAEILLPFAANEITRCCAGGARHYRERSTCTHLNAVGSTQNCARVASICCMRASIDGECHAGVQHALDVEDCAFDLYIDVGGTPKKECCECCMLAKNFISDGRECVAGVGFSSACLRTFNKCCRHTANVTSVPTSPDASNIPFGAQNIFPSESIMIQSGAEASGDGGNFLGMTHLDGTSNNSQIMVTSCDSTNCDHFCSIRLDQNTTECSCRQGYDLAGDGRSCIDIDECLLLIDNCLESQRCLNMPGSYKCIRTLTCGTGYALDSETEQCVDVDECSLGAHDCSPQYNCRNTPGSYRCIPRKCAADELLNPATGVCDAINCPAGFYARNDRCEDIDECAIANRCNPFEDCINLSGSYRCQKKGNLCSPGFYMDRESGFCFDINECHDGTHTCDNQQCINLPGTFKCRCSAGFEFNETNRMCEDVNECEKFAGHSCSRQATCENTVGSFLCHCHAGLELASDGRSCNDIDECASGLAKCQQKCVNMPGSYQCICEHGYQLSADELTCEDIDECDLWAKSGNELCMGKCVNTVGSFVCTCPSGFEVLADNITCKDIDECINKSSHFCIPDEELCVNTLGSYKCQRMDCPKNYVRDRNFQNRCVRKTNLCVGLLAFEEQCQKLPLHISWQYIAIPRNVNISTQRTSVTLFSMKGPNDGNSTMQFELRLVNAQPELTNVAVAVRENFLLQKGEHHNSAVVALRDSLDGPQTVHLELTLRLSTNGHFRGKYIANLIIHVSQFRPQIIYGDNRLKYLHHSHHPHK